MQGGGRHSWPLGMPATCPPRIMSHLRHCSVPVPRCPHLHLEDREHQDNAPCSQAGLQLPGKVCITEGHATQASVCSQEHNVLVSWCSLYQVSEQHYCTDQRWNPELLTSACRRSTLHMIFPGSLQSRRRTHLMRSLEKASRPIFGTTTF